MSYSIMNNESLRTPERTYRCPSCERIFSPRPESVTGMPTSEIRLWWHIESDHPTVSEGLTTQDKREKERLWAVETQGGSAEENGALVSPITDVAKKITADMRRRGRSYGCPSCKKVFTPEARLWRHIDLDHPTISAELSPQEKREKERRWVVAEDGDITENVARMSLDGDEPRTKKPSPQISLERHETESPKTPLSPSRPHRRNPDVRSGGKRINAAGRSRGKSMEMDSSEFRGDGPTSGRLFDPDATSRPGGKASLPFGSSSIKSPRNRAGQKKISEKLVVSMTPRLPVSQPQLIVKKSEYSPSHHAPIEDDPPEQDPILFNQPITKPISQEQLIAEVKGIYAGLVMVEAKCIEVDSRQARAHALAPDQKNRKPLNNEQWQALIAFHRTLLHEHHDFFMASQHPAASDSLKRLANKYAMPARMWRHGIHSFLEPLRHRLPESFEHTLFFLYLSYSMMVLLYKTVLNITDTWVECIGDLGRYRMAIEEGGIHGLLGGKSLSDLPREALYGIGVADTLGRIHDIESAVKLGNYINPPGLGEKDVRNHGNGGMADLWENIFGRDGSFANSVSKSWSGGGLRTVPSLPVAVSKREANAQGIYQQYRESAPPPTKPFATDAMLSRILKIPKSSAFQSISKLLLFSNLVTTVMAGPGAGNRNSAVSTFSYLRSENLNIALPFLMFLLASMEFLLREDMSTWAAISRAVDRVMWLITTGWFYARSILVWSRPSEPFAFLIEGFISVAIAGRFQSQTESMLGPLMITFSSVLLGVASLPDALARVGGYLVRVCGKRGPSVAGDEENRYRTDIDELLEER